MGFFNFKEKDKDKEMKFMTEIKGIGILSFGLLSALSLYNISGVGVFGDFVDLAIKVMAITLPVRNAGPAEII